ncbi:zinc finger and SCAN domain-containing protein 10 [Fundulus heteroclitus]|uniref:zinc finger and SCAN domain-containing protein 10 n=1 Tax=Fundulus heteroclitus TaxID=8078 RepID=UPI00165CD397|nr:zinc finger and SCAN domain-containing protein 10 [Fundulus heteroclitus]
MEGHMSRSLKLRLFVSQRLNAAVEEILDAFEKTIVKYEEEAVLSQQVISRQHALLCALNKPVMDAPAADVFTQQLLVPIDDRQNQNLHHKTVPEPSPVEEKQEEQRQALDAADIIEFTYSSRPSAKLRGDFQSLAGPKPVDPDQDHPVVLSSETEDSDDYSRDSADTRPASHKLPGLHKPRDGFSCQACSRAFGARRFLFRHVRTHVHDPKPVCGLCAEQFEGAGGLRLHLQTHTRKRALQNQARTLGRERRPPRLSGFNQSVKVQETAKPEESDPAPPQKRRRGRPRKNKEDANNQKTVKKGKRKI